MNNLEKRVLEINQENGGLDFANDVLQHGCVSGVVGELIYYKDTHAWFDEFYEEIEELRNELEAMSGEQVEVSGDLKNFYAWLSFEEMTRKLVEEGVIQ